MNKQINEIDDEISETLDEISILNKKFNEITLFYKNTKEMKTLEFNSIFGIIVSYITFLGTYNFAIDDATRTAVLMITLFSGIVTTFVPTIIFCYLLPNKNEKFLIKHFEYIEDIYNRIQTIGKALEEKNDYLLELRIRRDAILSGKRNIDIDKAKEEVYAFRKCFSDNLVLVNYEDEEKRKNSVKKRKLAKK